MFSLIFKAFTEKEAVIMGYTHEAKVYGVPVWLREDGEYVACMPKLYLLRHFLNVVDFLYSSAATIFLLLNGGTGSIPLPYVKLRKLPSPDTLVENTQ